MKLYWPIDPVRVTSGFGVERTGDRKHMGVDLAGEMGQDVFAVAAGTVSFCGYDTAGPGASAVGPGDSFPALGVIPAGDGLAGIFVEIDHGWGIVTQYAHLSGVPDHIRKGVQVVGGQVIGFVGDTGTLRSAPHLHFAVRRNGEAMDPIQLAQRGGLQLPTIPGAVVDAAPPPPSGDDGEPGGGEAEEDPPSDASQPAGEAEASGKDPWLPPAAQKGAAVGLGLLALLFLGGRDDE